MTTERPTTTADNFEVRLSEGLERLASSATTRDPGRFDPNPSAAPIREPGKRRTAPLLTAAAVAAAVTVSGLVAVSGRSDHTPASSEQPLPPAPVTATDLVEVEPTVSTTAETVFSAPTCGTDLPVTIEIPSAPDGPIPGPIARDSNSAGQLVQHWDLPGGTIEARWPADDPEIYDRGQVRGDQSVFDQMVVLTPEDGSQLMVYVPNIEPSVTSNGGSTLTMTATPDVADLLAPCDVVQIRYADRDGNEVTRGYNVTDLSGGRGENGDAFGADLNPLITSTGDAADAPDPATTVNCGGGNIDKDTTGPPAATPAEALAAFLAADETTPRFQTSGYREFRIDDDNYQYAVFREDGALVTLFTVSLTDQDWAVSHLTSAGC